jgi:hypothetical protein
MLDRLHAIDWQSLNASQMAVWIEDLISTNEAKRKRAGAKLLEGLGKHAEALGNVEEYGKILSSDAPVLVTPFFVDLLTMPEAPAKGTILKILDVLAGYKNKEGLEPIHLSRAEQIYQILLSNFDLYIPYLNADDAYTRINVMYLVSQFHEKLPLVIETLLDRLEKDNEPDELGKRCASEIIFETIQADAILTSQFEERLIRLLESWITSFHSSLSIKAQAALYLIRLQNKTIENSTIKLLANILKLPYDFALDVPLFLECVDAFMQLGIKRCIAILLNIFDDQTDVLQIFDTAVILMAINFGVNDYHNFRVSKYDLSEYTKIIIETETQIHPIQFPLNELQINVLDHLLVKDEIWNVDTDLFEVFHLPNSKIELQTLILSLR